ncbi:MAG: HIT family protein [Bacteroidota bacterium]
MASIFTRIINGEIPCYKISENENCIAFLDINPLKPGHTLVVPKIEIDNLFDLDEKTYFNLMDYSRKIAIAIEKSIPCNRVGVAVVGLEVPHAHIHLIPVDEPGDTDFSKPRVKLSTEEFKQIAQKIANEL